MIEVGQKVWCKGIGIKLFGRAPKYGEVLRVTGISGCKTFLKVEGYGDWYKAEDFSLLREIPKSLSDIKSELDVACDGWEYFYQRYGVKHMNSAFGLLRTYVDTLSDEVKTLREEIKELKEKQSD